MKKITFGKQFVTRQSTNQSLSSNGGDYSEWEEEVLFDGVVGGTLCRTSYDGRCCELTGNYDRFLFPIDVYDSVIWVSAFWSSSFFTIDPDEYTEKQIEYARNRNGQVLEEILRRDEMISNLEEE